MALSAAPAEEEGEEEKNAFTTVDSDLTLLRFCSPMNVPKMDGVTRFHLHQEANKVEKLRTIAAFLVAQFFLLHFNEPEWIKMSVLTRLRPW